eukprot:TRINITY_DN19539_c0_g1_i5.p1 TRINITY_DN19539_c0_g1~~TRINITY_DN19539_c0_g1_i5.p1  ORF type:complete len:725 (+),score=144.94 TRINITY_DN19539_c0_g1_i5:243-2417(+)
MRRLGCAWMRRPEDDTVMAQPVIMCDESSTSRVLDGFLESSSRRDMLRQIDADLQAVEDALTRRRQSLADIDRKLHELTLPGGADNVTLSGINGSMPEETKLIISHKGGLNGTSPVPASSVAIAQPGMEEPTSFVEWLKEHKEFCQSVARARQQRQEQEDAWQRRRQQLQSQLFSLPLDMSCSSAVMVGTSIASPSSPQPPVVITTGSTTPVVMNGLPPPYIAVPPVTQGAPLVVTRSRSVSLPRGSRPAAGTRTPSPQLSSRQTLATHLRTFPYTPPAGSLPSGSVSMTALLPSEVPSRMGSVQLSVGSSSSTVGVSQTHGLVRVDSAASSGRERAMASARLGEARATSLRCSSAAALPVNGLQAPVGRGRSATPPPRLTAGSPVRPVPLVVPPGNSSVLLAAPGGLRSGRAPGSVAINSGRSREASPLRWSGGPRTMAAQRLPSGGGPATPGHPRLAPAAALSPVRPPPSSASSSSHRPTADNTARRADSMAALANRMAASAAAPVSAPFAVPPAAASHSMAAPPGVGGLRPGVGAALSPAPPPPASVALKVPGPAVCSSAAPPGGLGKTPPALRPPALLMGAGPLLAPVAGEAPGGERRQHSPMGRQLKAFAAEPRSVGAPKAVPKALRLAAADPKAAAAPKQAAAAAPKQASSGVRKDGQPQQFRQVDLGSFAEGLEQWRPSSEFGAAAAKQLSAANGAHAAYKGPQPIPKKPAQQCPVQ